MRSPSRAGLGTAAVVVGLVGMVGSGLAQTAPSSTVRNPGAQVGKAGAGGPTGVPVWIRKKGSTITQVRYGTATAAGAFPTKSDGSRVIGGTAFFAGGGPSLPAGRTGTPSGKPAPAAQTMYQSVGLSFADTDLIRSGNAALQVKAALGGFRTQRDFVRVTARVSAAGQQIAKVSVAGPSVAARGGKTLMRTVTNSVSIPKAEVFAVRLEVVFARKDGKYSDGYADNVRFKIVRRSTAPRPKPVIHIDTCTAMVPGPNGKPVDPPAGSDITVSGRVLDASGQPLPVGRYLQGDFDATPKSGTINPQRKRSQPDKDGRFTLTFQEPAGDTEPGSVVTLHYYGAEDVTCPSGS